MSLLGFSELDTSLKPQEVARNIKTSIGKRLDPRIFHQKVKIGKSAVHFAKYTKREHNFTPKSVRYRGGGCWHSGRPAAAGLRDQGKNTGGATAMGILVKS